MTDQFDEPSVNLMNTWVDIIRLRSTWVSIVSRCCNPSDKDYRWYGGRGIRVCERWHKSLLAFLEDILREIGPKPSPKYSMDRIKNDLGYEPGNVRWATRSEQQRNKSTNHLVMLNGKLVTVAELSEQSGVNYGTVLRRLKLGQSVSQAILPPEKTVKYYTHDGKTLMLTEWSKVLGIPYTTLYQRVVLLEWPLDRAFSTVT